MQVGMKLQELKLWQGLRKRKILRIGLDWQ